MTFEIKPLVPELWCSDFEASVNFYTATLGFDVAQQRPASGVLIKRPLAATRKVGRLGSMRSSDENLRMSASRNARSIHCGFVASMHRHLTQKRPGKFPGP